MLCSKKEPKYVSLSGDRGGVGLRYFNIEFRSVFFRLIRNHQSKLDGSVVFPKKRNYIYWKLRCLCVFWGGNDYPDDLAQLVSPRRHLGPNRKSRLDLGARQNGTRKSLSEIERETNSCGKGVKNAWFCTVKMAFVIPGSKTWGQT